MYRSMKNVNPKSGDRVNSAFCRQQQRQKRERSSGKRMTSRFHARASVKNCRTFSIPMYRVKIQDAKKKIKFFFPIEREKRIEKRGREADVPILLNIWFGFAEVLRRRFLMRASDRDLTTLSSQDRELPTFVRPKLT